MAVTNTLLPLVQGQRIGLFAGSGVGKSSLLGHLAQQVEADVVVIALIGERGREVRHFMEEVLGAEGLQRTVIVTATSDQSPLQRRRCAWTAMAVAEHFRDAGQIRPAAGRFDHPLCRSASRGRRRRRRGAGAARLPALDRPSDHVAVRKGRPRAEGQGDITAVFSVLVAGSDMDEPVADILRGVLDGHIVLDRDIAERGRYPAIDVLRSVSRSLPGGGHGVGERAAAPGAADAGALRSQRDDDPRGSLYAR